MFVVVVRLTVSAQSWVIKARVSVRGYIRVKVRGADARGNVYIRAGAPPLTVSDKPFSLHQWLDTGVVTASAAAAAAAL